MEPNYSLTIKAYGFFSLMIFLVDWSAVFRPLGTETFRVHTNMCQNVGLLRIFPGITTQTVCSLLLELHNLKYFILCITIYES